MGLATHCHTSQPYSSLSYQNLLKLSNVSSPAQRPLQHDLCFFCKLYRVLLILPSCLDYSASRPSAPNQGDTVALTAFAVHRSGHRKRLLINDVTYLGEFPALPPPRHGVTFGRTYTPSPSTSVSWHSFSHTPML